MTEIRIRSFEDRDRQAVIELARELQAKEIQYFDRLMPPEQFGDWYLDYLLKCCAEDKGEILVAETEAESGALSIVGYTVVLTEVSSQEEVEEIDYTYAYVQDVAVTVRCRGRGIGSALLARGEQLAREAGAKWLRLTVLSENDDAVRVYRRAGFKPLLSTFEKPLDE